MRPQAAKLRALISDSAASAVKRRHVHAAKARNAPPHVDRGLKGRLEEMHMEEIHVVRLQSRLEELDVSSHLRHLPLEKQLSPR
jgi:hypothetical protein